MTVELNALIVTAASIGFFHTILGPDHYLPFIMMSWARKWSRFKTIVITFLCGLGHIASSVVLGLIGVWMGLAVKKLELIESARGNLAAWLLIAFVLAYLVWGMPSSSPAPLSFLSSSSLISVSLSIHTLPNPAIPANARNSACFRDIIGDRVPISIRKRMTKKKLLFGRFFC